MTSSLLTDLMRFPLKGNAISSFLSLFPTDMMWVVEDLESLSSHPNVALRSMLRDIATKETAIVTTANLREALESVDQVVNMTAKIQGSSEMGLFIEDGDIITAVVTARPT